MSHCLKVFFFALILFAGSGCGVGRGTTSPEKHSPAEAAAAAIALELGLPTGTSVRQVAPADLGKYRLQFDVFRASDANPAVGAFQANYVPSLVPESSLPESARAKVAQRLFEKLSRYEFAVLSRDGKPIRVNLVSTGESLPNGNFPLEPVMRTTQLEGEDGPSVPVSIPFPWLRTETLPDDPMTWGLWIAGGYFVESTPYYADLGISALNGGVNQSLPDAMELYTFAQATPTVVRIHEAGSAEAAARLLELAPIESILPQLDESRQKIAEVVNLLGPEVRLPGHGWIDPISGDFTAPAWPKCGVFDCFKSWKVPRPVGIPGNPKSG